MNQRAMVQFETEKNGRVYTLLVPLQAPYGEIYDFAFEVMNAVLEMQKKAAEQAKPKEESSEAAIG